MPKSAQINIRVDEQKKARWEEYVEESLVVTSMTDLIRLGVTQIIESDGNPRQIETAAADSSTSEGTTGLTPEQDNRLKRIEATLDGVESGVTAVEDHLKGQEDRVLSSIIAANLPQSAHEAQSTERIAEKLGIDRDVAREALERAENHLSHVTSASGTDAPDEMPVEHDPAKTYWWLEL